MKWQTLFSGKNKKNIIELLSAESALGTLRVNTLLHSIFGSATTKMPSEPYLHAFWTGSSLVTTGIL